MKNTTETVMPRKTEQEMAIEHKMAHVRDWEVMREDDRPRITVDDMDDLRKAGHHVEAHRAAFDVANGGGFAVDWYEVHDVTTNRVAYVRDRR